MTHSDDQGLVLPPKLAPNQVVVVPIFKSEDQLNAIRVKMQPFIQALRNKGISVLLDDRDTHKPGWKFAEYELKGVPVRVAVGPRDLENETVEVARRDEKTKEVVGMELMVEHIDQLLEDIQINLFNRAKAHREANTHEANSMDELNRILDDKGGFVSAHWDGTTETELKIKESTKATIRCIPLGNPQEAGVCIYSGKPSIQRVLFARAY